MIKEEVKNLGDAFKQRRKEMNMSLKEVENATSIRTTYLQAIEEGDVSKLISPVYAQGFIKQYAIYLGMDAEGIMRSHPEIFSRKEKQEFAYGIGTLEARGNPGAGVKWMPNFVWVAAFLAVLISAWYIAHYFEVL